MKVEVTKDQITSTLGKAQFFFFFGVIVTIIAPFILVKHSFLKGFDFSNTGPIGDTIGGITAPFVNILGAVLVYYALKAQIQANLAVQQQIEEQAERESMQNESNGIAKLYENLKDSIDNYSFSTLEPYKFGDTQSLTGSEAIYKLFQEFYCEYHGSESDMECNPKITEIISILEVCDRILKKLETSRIPDKDVMKVLTINQFRYRIAPRINQDKENLSKHFCGNCNMEHGLPDRVIELVKSINCRAVV